jgi:hypothetical protein
MHRINERFFQKEKITCMRTKQLPVLLFLCFALYSIGSEAQEPYTVYFRSGSYDPGISSKADLKRMIDSVIATGKKFFITVIGSTDNKGPDSLNYKLSGQRALAVKNFLVRSGFNEEDIRMEFNGEASPVAGNETEEGRRLNRRAAIIIKESGSNAVEKMLPPDNVPQGDIGELYSLLKTPADEFCIDLTRDTLLVGKRGTIIHYKANTIKKEGLSCKCFTLKLNEYFEKSDLIFNNLTTTSDGDLLESGGMIKLDGYCDGKKYELKPGESFTVMVPADTILPGMKLLSANRESDSAYLNWKIDPDNLVPDDFDWQRMMLTCGGVRRGPIASGKCPFFFCQIRDFFRGLFGGERKYKKSDVRSNDESEKEQGLIMKYELKGEELSVALQKSKENAGKDALKYYVYKNSNWDYRNIDRYKGGTRFINFIVENKPDHETDVKIVFKISKTVVPCFERGASYVFKNINDDADVWVVGLKYTVNKEIYLGLKEINTSEKRTKLDYRQVTVEELKTIMRKINK